ncbi:MAG: hypothetical protein ACYCT2_01830 [Thermoplasmataceae archaeon]
MNGETDYGIIMSALAMGDLRDTQSRIRKRILRLKAESRVDPARNFGAYIRMLEGLESVLSGKKKVEDFRKDMNSATVSGNFRFVDNWEDFVDTVVYYLYYFIDRYNINLPAFNSKRSDDR